MGVHDIISALRPVVEDLGLVDSYLAPEEVARAGELAKEIRAIFDTAVERLKCGRVS